MRAVHVTGIGKTAFGSFPDSDLRSLSLAAIQDSLLDAAIQPRAIQAFYLGNFAGPSFVGQNHLAPLVGHAAGFAGIPCTRVENACASSGSAFFHAWLSVASGVYDCVLVAGVEKMTSQTTARVTEILAGAGDMSNEGAVGATFPALFAMIARRHMHEYGTTRAQMAAVSVKNHANGALNPLAHMRKPIKMEQVLAARMVADPLSLFDCSLVSDGAAATVLQAADHRRSQRDVRVLACAQTSDSLALEARKDITTMSAVAAAGKQAYEAAGLGPGDVQLAELHDCFTIAEIVASEDLGFVPKGDGGRFAEEGRSALEGRLPINASGGLKAKGHPVGATGVGQICDLVQQVRGEAGTAQVARHQIGLAQNLGGSGATCVVTIVAAQ